MMKQSMYFVTICSNVSRGYDKYTRTYDKGNIPESSFPNHFFLLKKEELSIGLEKATRLLQKLNYEHDYPVVLETESIETKQNDVTGTGLGWYTEGSSVIVKHTYRFENKELKKVPVEEILADSYAILHQEQILCSYEEIQPRSISFLPIAIGCQAGCPFCFSKSSVSAVQKQKRIPFETIEPYFIKAKKQGANRAVITGGGEPTLIRENEMLQYIRNIKQYMDKIVLITNGYEYSKVDEEKRIQFLQNLEEAGLSVLAISRHAADEETNSNIMYLETQTPKILETFRNHTFSKLTPRLICVLQKGGVEDESSLSRYLDFTAQHDVKQICFKELYVSTSKESLFYEKASNQYSYAHQIPLSMVVSFCEKNGFQKISELPWGSPVYRANWNGKQIDIACYTEPSLYWEKINKLARSWNVMSDGTCYASLEDTNSIVTI